MKQKSSLFLFISVVVQFVSSQYEGGCYPNEIFTPSVNPCNTCDVRGYCPEYSGPGCDCAPGLFRNSYGACVPPEGCDGPYNTNYKAKDYPAPVPGYPAPVPSPVCGTNEEYTDCGTPCPRTCETRCPVCTLQCIKGCFCRRGYVRKNGRCVPPQDCEIPQIPPPQQCGANEIFLDCGSACPPTCQNTQQTCTLQCVRGCFCITGYVRRNGICIPLQACTGNNPPSSYSNSGPINSRRRYPAYSNPAPSVGPVTVKPPVIIDPIPPTPENPRGCPSRNRCNRFCKSIGSAAGFCVGPNFLRCNCMG